MSDAKTMGDVMASTLSKFWQRDRPDPPPPCNRCGRPVAPMPAPWGGWFIPPLCGTTADPWPEPARVTLMYGAPNRGYARKGTGCQGEADQREGVDPGADPRRVVDLDSLLRAGLGRRQAEDALRLRGKLDRRLQVPAHGGQNWAFLWSPERGCGKTTQLALAIAYALRQGWHARYVSHEALLQTLRPQDGMSAPHRTVRWWVEEVEVLAIDSLADTRLTEWGMTQTRQILEGRYDRKVATIIASDRRVKDLAGQGTVGAAIASRIVEETGRGRRAVELTHNFRLGRDAKGAA